jgi:hypothetical protein
MTASTATSTSTSTGIDTGALLSRSHRLASGQRVRLRLPQRADRPRLAELLGISGEPLLAGIARPDPLARIVICATVPHRTGERVVGVGSAPLERDGSGPPEVVVIDRDFDAELGDLLLAALADRLASWRRRRAA